MKRIAKFLGIALLVSLSVATVAVGYLYVRKPAMAAPSAIRVEATAVRLARGKYLFTLADCDACHSQRDFSRFGGPVVNGGRGIGTVFPDSMGLPGRVAPPNITPDQETGIGAWTDGEKIRAIREGIGRDGHVLFPMMPYTSFRHMSDEDVYSLVAYLNSLQPVKHRVPRTMIQFPVSLLIKDTPRPTPSVAAPDRSDARQYGRYLVTVAGCMECHTAKLSGGKTFRMAPDVVVVSANISPDPDTGIGKWSEQDFLDRFYQYREYVQNGSPLASPQSFTVMPWLNFCQLSAEDLRAVYAFLRSQPPRYQVVDTHPGGWAAKPGLVSKLD
jgi:mono/diheme cytochrome c family protein